jgi:hypothetical protein
METIMTLPTLDTIQSRIIELPGRPPLMLAADLAAFYGVAPKRISEAMKRNPDRFPPDFFVYLSEDEASLLRSQNVKATEGKWPQRTLATISESSAISRSFIPS